MAIFYACLPDMYRKRPSDTGSELTPTTLSPLTSVHSSRFETPEILRRVASARGLLGELKGVAATIPNQHILISTLGIQEAKDSSEIENIVTTHDELFRDDAYPEEAVSGAAKEVLRYRHALWTGFDAVRSTGLLTSNQILSVQAVLEPAKPGYRRIPGTTLKDGDGNVVYRPPSPEHIDRLMSDLDRFINDSEAFDADPLVRMALIHHQFESIHPFYDGNGRTGRIVNVLYLVKEGMLDIPVLYLSRHIVRTKGDYYRLLQLVREEDHWEEWVLYILAAVEATAADGIRTINEIRTALLAYKRRIRDELQLKFYSQDLLNNLFSHPYTKVQFVMDELNVSRLTATRYLDILADSELLVKRKVGRSNYYMNVALTNILINVSARTDRAAL